MPRRRLNESSEIGVGAVVVGEDSTAPITTQVTYVERQHVYPASTDQAAVALPVLPVPWPRNPNFVGRDLELNGLRDRLAGAGSVLPQALHGWGGVGKTQLAVEYCYLHARDYDLVWWVPAGDPSLVVESLTKLAEHVKVGVAGQAEESAQAVVELLGTGGDGRFARWLVVLDNAGDPSEDPMIDRLLRAAAAGCGHVLVTSRDPRWARLAVSVEIDVLPRVEAVRLLCARVKGLSTKQAGRLATVLGRLPLALEQAGAWLAESGMPVSTYEDLLRQRTGEMLSKGTADGQMPVAATWTVALDAVDDPAVVMLVRLWAHLGPEPVPLHLLDFEGAWLPEPLATVVRDPAAWGDVIAKVSRLGLVRLTYGQVVMHRLVQGVLREHTPEGERAQLRAAVVRLLAAAADGDPADPRGWSRYAQLYPHARAADLIGSGDQRGRAAVKRFAAYLHYRGDDLSGDRLARDARASWTKTLDENHPDVLVAEAHAAYLLRKQGKYLEAKALSEAVRSRCLRHLGKDHPTTIRVGACLGMTLRAHGDYPAARDLFEEILSQYRHAVGGDHPDTICAAANLAETLREQGEYQAARHLFEKTVLPWRRHVLGEDHWHTISAAASLAATLRKQGEYQAARHLEQDVLSRLRRLLGDDHPRTIKAVANLATTLREQGEYEAAQAEFEDVLSRRQRVLGEDHPDTLTAAADLALTMRAMGGPSDGP